MYACFWLRCAPQNLHALEALVEYLANGIAIVLLKYLTSSADLLRCMAKAKAHSVAARRVHGVKELGVTYM